MSTKTQTNVDISKMPDLDKVVPCQMIGYDGEETSCAAPAKWLRIYGCCGGQRTYCTEHMLRVIREVGLDPYGFMCYFCGESPASVGEWREL